MKKALIAGAASTVLAAMPIVGVFAVQTGTVTDTVTLTVNKTCKMEATAATGTYNLGAQPGGEYAAVEGTPMTITCNANSGWNLTAEASAMTSETTSQTIPFGTYGTSASVWSAKIALSGNNTDNVTVTNGWLDFGATASISGAETIIAANVADTAVNGLVVTPSYKAYVADDQAQGLYSGTIVYTFTDLTN